MKLLMMLFIAAKAFEIPMAPEKNHLNIGLFRNRHQITIPLEGFELAKDTTIKVDELRIEGPLITNGFKLKIDVSVLKFEGGSIIGFRSPAHTGALGAPGENGLQDVKAIEIFAPQILGEVVIDGTGQRGGNGGQGLQGAQGIKGLSGQDAKATCYSFFLGRNVSGTPGLKGGQGQIGGKGAVPGLGGKAIPLIIQTASSLENSKLKSESGLQGDPGAAGLPGLGGIGGDGGKDIHLLCGKGLYKVGVEGGAQGPQGEMGVGTLGPGDSLQDQAVVKSLPEIQKLDELDLLRKNIQKSFGLYHWARSLKALKQDGAGFGLPITEVDDSPYLKQARDLCEKFYSQAPQHSFSYFSIPACENARLNQGEILMSQNVHQEVPMALMRNYEELATVSQKPSHLFYLPQFFESAKATGFVVEDIVNSNRENFEIEAPGIFMGYPSVAHFDSAGEIEQQLLILNSFKENLIK